MNKKITLLFIITLVGTLMQISTDMYTPSLPAISHYFHVPIGSVQLTMTLLLLGVSVSCLIYGPISEIVGRRWTLFLGISLAIAGSLMCLFAHNIHILQLGRLIQGCGLGATTSQWRSIFRDTYQGDEIARVASYLTNIIIVSIIVAPLIGGYIQHYLSWRYTFLVLTGWSALVLGVVMFVFKETGQHHGRHRLNIAFMRSSYRELCTSRRFIGFSLCSFLTFGGTLTWLTAGPVVLIKGAGISPLLFGWLTIIMGVAMGIGSTLNAKLVKRVGSQRMMKIGWVIMATASLLLIIAYQIKGTTTFGVIIPSAFFILGTTFIYPNAFANAFTDIGHIAGYGAGLYSATQQMGGAFFSAILSHLSTVSPLPMALLFLASSVVSWLVFHFVANTDS